MKLKLPFSAHPQLPAPVGCLPVSASARVPTECDDPGNSCSRHRPKFGRLQHLCLYPPRIHPLPCPWLHQSGDKSTAGNCLHPNFRGISGPPLPLSYVYVTQDLLRRSGNSTTQSPAKSPLHPDAILVTLRHGVAGTCPLYWWHVARFPKLFCGDPGPAGRLDPGFRPSSGSRLGQ